MIHTSQQSTKKDLTNNLKEILDQSKQLIETNKSEHPTVTLATTYPKPMGEGNPYVRFGYGPLKFCNHTWVQVSVSINNNPISMIHSN